MSLLTQFFRSRTVDDNTASVAETFVDFTNENALTAFNACDFETALNVFTSMELSKYTVTMMIKCHYRMNAWTAALDLFNNHCVLLGDLCTEMQYIRARCLYEHGLESTNENQRMEILNNALLIAQKIATTRQHANVKYDLLVPQIHMAIGYHMAAYETATVLLTRPTLSNSKYAELLMLRARAARMLGDNETAMVDYYAAIDAANYTNNWALLGVLHADIIGYSKNNRLDYSHDISMHVASEFTPTNKLAAVNYKVQANHYFKILGISPSRDLETSRYVLLSLNNARRFAENVIV